MEGFVWKFDREYRSLQPLCDLEIGLQETRLGKLYWARLLFVLFFFATQRVEHPWRRDEQGPRK